MTDATTRCSWCGEDPLYTAYHDEEWGRPVHDDTMLYEHLCLEGFQCGLSWITVLRKRENFRRAFHDFAPRKVAAMEDQDVERLCQDAGIIRNRAKIRSTINNAKRLIELQESGSSLDELAWSFAPKKAGARPCTVADLKANTPESEAFSRAMKKHGFSFVGPTGLYAFMQSVGIVDDHVASCFVALENDKKR